MSAVLLGWALTASGGLLLARRVLLTRAEVVARAGHDLRVPLTAALLAVHAARREGEHAWGAPLDAAEAELLRAGHLAGEVTAAASGRADRARRPRAVVDLGALLARQARSWELLGAVRGRGVRVRAAAGCLAPADGAAVVRAVTNLVANAIEHGDGIVDVTVRSAEAGRVRIEVCDEGAGLPALVAALAGLPPRGGRGRGLAIATAVAEAHHGRLRAAPAACGARLVLELPRRGRRAHATRCPHAVTGAAHRGVSRRRRAVVLGVLAALLGGFAASDVAGRESALARAVGPLRLVLVTRTRLRAGEVLTPARLAVRTVPVRYAPAGAFAAPADVRALKAAVALPPGADLTPAVVSDGHTAPVAGAPVGRGERVAVFVALGDPALIAAGGRVDILVTRERADGDGATSLALEDAEVLSAVPAPAATGGGGDGDVASGPRVRLALRVSLRDAVYLAAAQSFAKEIRVLPRAAGDDTTSAAGVRVGSSLDRSPVQPHR